MGKFDKAMGAMDDEMLENVSGGYIPQNLNDKDPQVLIGLYNDCKEVYWWYVNNGQGGTPACKGYLEALETYEAELTRRGIPFSREL